MANVRLEVCSNVDDVHLVWDHDDDISNFLSFAIHCSRGDSNPTGLSNRVGFDDDTKTDDQAGQLSVDLPKSGRSTGMAGPTMPDLVNTISFRGVARIVSDDGKLMDVPASDWSPNPYRSAPQSQGIHADAGILAEVMCVSSASHLCSE